MSYAELVEFCETDRQRQLIGEIVKTGSIRKAATSMKMDGRNAERMLARIRLIAANRGYSPVHDMTHSTPPTHQLKGTSTFYNRDGKMAGQWVKTERVNLELGEAIRAIADGLKDDLPKYSPVAGPKQTLADLHNLYVITDYHMGMLSWGEETGTDWDLDIAEKTLLDWFSAAVRSAPNSESCTFAQLGDFLHWDGLEALTPASKHVLDADTRFQKVVRCAIRCIRRIIGMLLEKHKEVRIIMADANHDPASGVWLREWLAHVYEMEPRVKVNNSADTYYAEEFGSNLLMFHHGHKKAPKDIDSVFVAKFRKAFGRTEHHYAHMGHLHHDVIHESNLMKVEQHRTLAAQDAYASRAGYISGRDSKVITYHSKFGEVMRLTISPEMLRHG